MRAIALAALALLASPAFAQEGMYVGLSLGRFDFQESRAGLAPGPFDGTASSWRLYGGFEFNEHVAMEIHYGATGRLEQPYSGTDPSLGDFTSTFRTDFKTTSVMAVGMLPKDWGTLLGGLGLYQTKEDVDLDLTASCCGNLTDTISVNDNGTIALLGLEWRFGRFGTGVAVRVEYEWMDISDADASTVSLGIAYRF